MRLLALALLLPGTGWAQDAAEDEPPPEAPADDAPQPEEPAPAASEPAPEPEPEPVPVKGGKLSDDPTLQGTSEPTADPDATDDGGWGDDDSGWGDGDDAGFADTSAVADDADERPWRFSGVLRTQEALWVERLPEEPVALARQAAELSLHLSWNDVLAKATVHGEVDPKYLLTDAYDDVVRTYGWRLEPRELWVGTSLGPVELTAGRQVVAWGEGLILSPVDVVNARDTRDPGMTDLDDLRRPVTMLRIQAFLGSHRFEVLGVPESDFGLRSSPEGPYGLMPGLAAAAESPDFISTDELLAQIDTEYTDIQSRWAVDQFQAFARWTWRGPGFDLAAYGATLLDKQGVIVNPEGEVNLLQATELAIPLDHRRYTLAGLSGSAVVRRFALRAELVAEWGRAYNFGDIVRADTTGPTFTALSTDRDVYTGMIGATWTGVSNLRVDVEASRGYLPQGRANLTMPVGETQYALRLSYLTLSDRLSLDAFAAGLGTRLQYGFIASAAATYELSDGLHATLGYVTYQPSDQVGPLIGMDTHDRLFAQVKWRF